MNIYNRNNHIFTFTKFTPRDKGSSFIVFCYGMVLVDHTHIINSSHPGQNGRHSGIRHFDVSSIGRFFRSLLWRWRKMAALPLPVAILDDLISGSRKWGHPRWRPEAEGPPFCATATIGVEKTAPGPGWRHFRPRHLGSKMATVEMTSRGRRDAREDVLQTSASSMSPEVVWLYLDLKSIWSLASPRHYPSDWVSCPLATTRKWSVCTCRKLWKTFDFSKHLLYFFLILFFYLFNCTLQ